jgi:hypothetical protein
VLSLGSFFTQLFSREKKAEAAAARQMLVARLTGHGKRTFDEVGRRTGLGVTNLDQGPELDGSIRGVHVRVSVAENGEGLMMRFSARSPAPRDLVVNVAPKPAGLRAVFGKPGKTGDPEMDALFSTTATDGADPLQIVDERARSTLLSMPDRMPLFFDYRNGEVTLDLSGVELDPDRLVFVLEWLVSVASGSPEGEKPYRS